MWVPVPPSAEAALAGATVLANLSGSPITVARAEDRRLLVRSRPARAATRPTSSPPPARASRRPTCRWDGQTMVYECGDLLGESERFPDGPAAHGRRRRPRPDPAGAAAAGHLRRQPADAGGPGRGVPHGRRSSSTRRPATSACAARSTGSRSCPTTPSGSRWTATRPTTSRSPGSSSGCSAIGQPEGRHRRQRRPRLHPRADRRGQGDGPARPAAQRHPRVHDAGLRDRRAPPSRYATRLAQGARRDLRGARHPAGGRADARRTSTTRSPTARRSTTSPSRTSRPGCAPTTCSGSPTSAAASCSAPATCPSWRSAGAPTASATRCRTTTSTPASRRP